MSRLQSELNRLYRLGPRADAATDAPSSPVDSDEAVRALVLELTRPPSWELLAKVWRGVQADLELPAPAIAVSGTDGLQLWFSLAEPVAPGRAQAFLQRLRQRFLPEVESSRVRLMLHAPQVPAEQGASGNWSAFVAADLAPVFAETPWLDIPPSDDGQAALLSGLAVMPPAAFEAAMRQLDAGVEEPAAPPVDAHRAQGPAVPALADGDPGRFLLRVMNDETVALALRIEAAKALLQHANAGG